MVRKLALFTKMSSTGTASTLVRVMAPNEDSHRRSLSSGMATDEPPYRVSYNLEEVLDFLAALEDARDTLSYSDHLAVVAQP